MQISQQALLAILCGALAGCSIPGKQDLVEKGYTETVVVQQDHKQLAECLTRTLDNEPPYRWGELQTPVTRSIPSADGNSIDLQGSYPLSPTILLWTANITQVAPGQSKVEMVGRRGLYVAGSVPDRYVVDKLRRIAESCAKA